MNQQDSKDFTRLKHARAPCSRHMHFPHIFLHPSLFLPQFSILLWKCHETRKKIDTFFLFDCIIHTRSTLNYNEVFFLNQIKKGKTVFYLKNTLSLCFFFCFFFQRLYLQLSHSTVVYFISLLNSTSSF